jgi:hypothetical protein
MSDLSPELNLALAVDDDDTADYLVTTPGLRGSLVILDGMFNSVTGHAHNGSHQGGNLQFLDLNVGQNLTVVGATDLKGSAIMRQSVHIVGAATLDALATINSLDVTTTTHLRGAVTIDGQINSGTLVLNNDLTVGRDLSVGRNATVTGVLTVGSINGTAGLTITGAASISGLLTAGRVAIGGIDYGASVGLSVNIAVAANAFYQRGSLSYRCWDNADFTFGVAPAGSTLVQRDGSGYIQASYISLTADVQAGKPTHVLGRIGADNYLRWWPTNAIGPPISTWYCQANIQLPSLSNNGGSQDATFNATAISGGFGCSGNLITVPRPGYYTISGGFNGNNLTGNQETMDMTLISSAHGTLDSMGVPLKITSYLGGYFSWSGFLNQGETIRLNFRTSFDSINGNGEIIVAFIPTADFNN